MSDSLERLQYGSRFGRRRALARAGRDLLELRDLDRLCASLVDSLEAGLDVRPANLLLLHGGDLVPLMPRAAPLSPIPADKLPDELWQANVASLSGVEMLGEQHSPMQQLFAAGYRYAFPLLLHSKRIGVLIVGYKDDEVPLSSDDVDLVRNLLNQAALAIENAQLLDEVHRQPGRGDAAAALQPGDPRILAGRHRGDRRRRRAALGQPGVRRVAGAEAAVAAGRSPRCCRSSPCRRPRTASARSASPGATATSATCR